MCGIVGIFNVNQSPAVDEGNLRQMLAMIRHRGPDQFGIYLEDGIGLGSARLSILDLEGGQQPIGNETCPHRGDPLWIVFNGEIFNHVELRAELETRGHRFRTRTDTEVILHLFETYGPDCLSRLNGQFAIAVWNSRARTLFLARDRLGVRPLFYASSQGALVFGSEIKALLAAPQVKAEIDVFSLGDIFTYWSALSPRTIFRDILEIPPGHYLLADRNGISIRNYWQVTFDPDGAARGRARPEVDDYLDEFRDLLVDATRIRLRADVPVGAYLSGGLDSSVIASIIASHSNSRLETFSVAFDDPEFDESRYQRRMADVLGTRHHVVRVADSDIGDVFPDVVWHAETPVMRTAPAPLFMLSRLVRDHRFKVVLTGEGADEFLAGYNIFKESRIRRFWARQPESVIRPLLLRRLYPHIRNLPRGGGDYLAGFFRHGLTDVDAPDYSHAVRWHNNKRTRRFFSSDVNRALAGGTAAGVRYPPEFSGWNPLHRAQYLEISIFMSQYLLSTQGDRMAMAHSVEGRFPFLDHRLVEYCNRLPPGLKLRNLTDKYILRRMGRDRLPEEVRRRPKQPYRAPIQRSFFHASTPDYVRELLSPGQIGKAGLFDPVAVGRLVGKIDRGIRLGETDEMALAGIISSQLVQRQFVSRFRMPPPLSRDDDVKLCVGS